MKLHIPKPLLKALILALSTSYAIAAATYNEADKTLTYTGTENNINIDTGDGSEGVADVTVIFNGVEGGFTSDGNTTYTRNIVLTGTGWAITDGRLITSIFSGSISGSGDFTKTGSGGSGQIFIFTGNLTGFTGNFTSNAQGYERGCLGYGNSTVALGPVTNDAAGNYINNVMGTGSISANLKISIGYIADSSYNHLKVTNAITAGNIDLTNNTANLVFTNSVRGYNDTQGTVTFGSAITAMDLTDTNQIIVTIGSINYTFNDIQNVTLFSNNITTSTDLTLTNADFVDVDSIMNEATKTYATEHGLISTAKSVTITGGTTTLAEALTLDTATINGGILKTESAASTITSVSLGSGSIDATDAPLTIGNLTNTNNGTNVSNLSGNITINGTWQGLRALNVADTINILDGAHITASSMTGRYEMNGTTTINIQTGSQLNILNTFQTARDGKTVLNIQGRLIANQLELGQNWSGAANVKGSTVNLQGGELFIGSGGITASNNIENHIINLESGTIGTTAAEWTSSLNMSLGATGSVTFNTQQYDANTNTYKADAGSIALTGIISGDGSIIKAGTGTLTLGGANTFTGGLTIESGTVTLGNASALGTGITTLSSTDAILNLNNQAVTNKIVLTNGSLQNAGAYTGELVINQSGTGVTVGQLNLGGLSGGTMNITSGINGNTVTTLTGITGTVSLIGNNTIALNSEMLGGTPGATSAIDATGGTISLGSGATLDLKLTDTLSEALLNNTTLITANLNVTSGTLIGDLSQISLSSTYAAFKYIYKVTSISGGQVVLTQNTTNTLVVPDGQSLDISSGNQLGVSNKDHVINNGTINITAPAGTNVALNGFEGGKNGILNTGTDTNTTITFAQGGLGDADTAVYQGAINGSAGLDKTGAFTQQLSGNVTASSVTVSQGKLVFATPGGESIIDGNINVANGATLGVTGTGTTLTGTTLTSQTGSTIDIGKGSTLNITNTATGGTTIDGNVTGSGTLEIHGDLSLGATGGFIPSGSESYNTTTLKLNNNASFNVSKNIQMGALTGTGTLNLAGNTLTLGGANGVFEGAITGNAGSKIAMNGSNSASQVLYGAGNANTALDVAKGTLILQNKEGANASYGATNVASGATLQIGGYPGGPSALEPHSTNVHLDSLSLASGSTLNLYFGNNATGDLIPPALTTTTAVNIGSNVTVKVGSYISDNDISLKGATDVSLTLIHGESGTASISSDSTNPLMGFLTALYEWKLKAEGSDIILDGTVRQGNYYDQAGLTHNSSAVADLLYHASDAIIASPNSTLRGLADYVADSINLGNIDAASQAMSAASGSTITGLSMAQNNQMNDEMQSIRNRTITMGANQGMDNDDAPYYHFWIQGNGGYNDLKTSRDESGYELTSWGGTVGMDVDFNDRWTGGIAFSTSFGDLKAHGADSASGDLDSYYLSLFARYQRKAWAHTMIVTGGWNDMKLNRTVNYGDASYEAHGKTHGGGFGAMYELTYDINLREDATSILQPLFNIAVASTSVKGYDETGAGNAGLRVNKMDMTTTTLGLGGRWIGLFGANLFGRESVGQFRANVSQELGDNRGKANVAFLGNAGYSQEIIGAKAGTTALQLGASISTPINQNSSVFMEANADFRSKQNSVNGSIGYRYDF